MIEQRLRIEVTTVTLGPMVWERRIVEGYRSAFGEPLAEAGQLYSPSVGRAVPRHRGRPIIRLRQPHGAAALGAPACRTSWAGRPGSPRLSRSKLSGQPR